MKINIVLPSFPIVPVGGVKIMYEYANLFAKSGYDVVVYHSMNIPYVTYHLPFILRKIRYRLFHASGHPKWFSFYKDIEFRIIPFVRDKYVRDADFMFSTMWITAFESCKLSESKGKKINLIQGYELWIGNRIELLHKSYCLPMTHIVIADYLADIVEKESGIRPFIVYNAVNSSIFKIMSKIEERNPFTISMLYSTAEIKGSKYGLEALRLCKKKVPQLEVLLFGVCSNPHLPETWIHYTREPKDLCSIYNSTAIFFTPSNTEGWGLPATESMFCGCALVCTRVGGHLVFAKDNITALCVEPRNPEDMSEKLIDLLLHKDKRISLAVKGNEYIQKFSWESAFQKIQNIMECNSIAE